jgi:chromosomal replication initiator protein
MSLAEDFSAYSRESAHRASKERRTRMGGTTTPRPISMPPRTVAVMTKIDKVKSKAPAMRVPSLEDLPLPDTAACEAFTEALARSVHNEQKARRDVLSVEAISDMIEIALRRHQQDRPLSLDRIQRAVAARYGLSRGELLAPRRSPETIIPRWIAFYLAKVFTRKSLNSIGKGFAGRDHTTVIYGIKQIEQRLAQDDSWLRKEIEWFTQVLVQAGGVKR